MLRNYSLYTIDLGDNSYYYRGLGHVVDDLTETIHGGGYEVGSSICFKMVIL